MMERVWLIHWNKEEAREKAARLSAAGYEVAWEMQAYPKFLRGLKDNPPAAIVIDLSRIPSQGRDLGVGLRKNAGTRRIPLIFVEGDAASSARLRELLPDAHFANWSGIRKSLRQAITHPLVEPHVPDSVFAAYSGTPLVKKLGIAPGVRVKAIDAPEDFMQALGKLPDGASLSVGQDGHCDILICFIRSREDLGQKLKAVSRRLEFRSVWFAWPKKAANPTSDLSQQSVREAGLSAGLVDYKICAIDATWSALLFTRRKPRNEDS